LQEVSDSTARSPQRFYRLKIPAPTSSARINLEFKAQAGRAYAIEYCDSLESNSWQVLTRINPLLETSTVTISDAEHNQRFYRLRSR
jgi:hypothetical protein